MDFDPDQTHNNPHASPHRHRVQTTDLFPKAALVMNCSSQKAYGAPSAFPWWSCSMVGASGSAMEGQMLFTVTLTWWLMPALTTDDSHLIYTYASRHGQQDLMLLKHNPSGRFVLMSSGACSIWDLTVVIIRMSPDPWRKKKKKDAYNSLTLQYFLSHHRVAKATYQH